MPLTDNPADRTNESLNNQSLFNKLLGTMGINRKEHQLLVELQAKTENEHERLTALLNTIDTGVITTDSEGMITLYNSAALAILNINSSLSGQQLISAVKILGPDQKPIDLIKEVNDQDRTIEHLDTTLSTGQQETLALRIVTAPIHSNYKKRKGGYVITLRDITKAKSLDDQRNEFISVTSHELRTPIATIEASLSTALIGNMREGMKPEALKMLEMAHKNVLYLGNLVKDLATLARAEGQYLGIDINPVDPKKVIDAMHSNFSEEALSKGLNLVVSPMANLHPVLSSEIYISEVLQNFITNAIKYTEKGVVTIGAENANDNAVRFWVEDTGIGISQADQKKLFTKFFRVEDFQTRETGGTGLGLYITQKLAERVGGKVGCKSELGKGSVFYLEIPPVSNLKTDARKISDAEIEDFANAL